MNHTPSDKKPLHRAHTDARVVLTRPMVVTAGGSQSHAPIRAVRLVMAGNPKPIIEGLPGYVPVIIRLDWPDLSTPDMTESDWKWLANRIRSLHRPLHVSCAMGHGRTGSCLTLLAHFWGQIPRKADPVLWLRDRYCQEAIETLSQIRYIERITGRTSTAKPKEPALVPATSGGYTYTDGWSKDRPHVSGKAFKSFPDNAASRAATDGPVAGYVHRTCAHINCVKLARENQVLCDNHYFATLPMPEKGA